jgi:hypothetical protein
MPRPAKSDLSIFAKAERLQKKLAKLEEQRAKAITEAGPEVLKLIEAAKAK